MTSSFVTLKTTDGSLMRAYVSEPSIKATRAMIVFQEAFGVNDSIRRMADRFAEMGLLVIAPELFHRTAEPGFEAAYGNFEAVKPHFGAITEASLEADAKTAHDWLLTQGIAPDQVHAVGFCLGGRAAYVANSVLSLRRAISFYGGGTHLLTHRAESLQGPHLFFWGGKDTHILPEHRRAIMEALDKAGKDYTHVVFSQADHAFMRDVGEAFHPKSADMAWAIVKEFLK